LIVAEPVIAAGKSPAPGCRREQQYGRTPSIPSLGTRIRIQRPRLLRDAARSQYDGLHHMQFTLKNPLAVHRAFDHMKERGKVELIWGPLRHGAGHNIVFYFRDHTGNIVEYSAEEEIILNDATYVPRAWPVTDPRAGDEWNLSPIPAAMM
jgi:hypothetical protein